MKRPFVLGSVVLVVLVALLLGLPWLSPAKGVERAGRALLEDVQDNDFDDVAAAIDPGYEDAWGLSGAEVVAVTRALRRHFIVCAIERRPFTIELAPGRRRAVLRTVLRLDGTGTGVAQALIQHTRQNEAATTFEWVRRTWKPWDWKLVRVDHPGAAAGVRRLQREIGLGP